MILNEQLLADIRTHAAAAYPSECCGFILSNARKQSYRACRNIATENEHFVIHPEDHAAAEDAGTILAVVHSHPGVSPEPSQADKVGIERSGLPWVIVNHPAGHYTVTKPSGYVAPLAGREFVHGVLDCLQLIVDYYQQVLGITIPHFERVDKWWLNGQDLYRTHMDEAGFVEVPIDSLKLHDVILMKVASPVENHGAVYLGDNRIIHHISGKLSCHAIYGGWYQKMTTGIIRHKALMGTLQ